ncbi:galactoside transporter permease MglC [Salmonella enterica subsp. enterica]|uniref:Galactoside transporter permease MglC n=1 Tax=Salmonella enterica I TaxID=59201 RepID=A0A379USL2_SALET|nr:galactoside transporter permease MglC [Salmonella enterica subsp. enterica]
MSALNKKSFLTWLKEGGIYVVLLVLLAIIIFQDPTFLSLLNLSNILTQSSVRIIIALAWRDSSSPRGQTCRRGVR